MKDNITFFFQFKVQNSKIVQNETTVFHVGKNIEKISNIKKWWSNSGKKVVHRAKPILKTANIFIVKQGWVGVKYGTKKISSKQ